MILVTSQGFIQNMPCLIDLHCHSTVSDGTLTPTELVQHAASQGVRAMALTDHDDMAGLEEARQVANSLGLHFINGVEISVTWRKRTLHIVGLNIDPSNHALVQGLANIRHGRHLRAEGMAAGLDKHGITGSLVGAYQYAKQGIISRTHFARFLIEQGHAKNMKAVFKRFLIKGKPGYVEHQWASLEDAVAWIVNSGGVAVLAHPGRYDMGKPTMLELLEEFRTLGGKAIEVVTGSHTPEHYLQYAKLSEMFSLQASVGSDFHGHEQSYMDMGHLPELPRNCKPVWQQWPELSQLPLVVV